ncbi:MAG TPA: hypothetical protein PK350_11475 [Deltaproteobacteria bacterium]|nr:hypothetical protein [Deltaproteobacteria bacterium]
MIIYALRTIKRLWMRWLGNPFHGVKLYHITDEDLCFDPDVERMIRECELQDAFKSCGSLEDYNKDFVNFFTSNRRQFHLDYSQKDGHFRV